MIPLSGRGQVEITRAFNSYKTAAKDDNAYLVDLGRIEFATADRQHPTAAGHQEIYQAAVPALDAIVRGPGRTRSRAKRVGRTMPRGERHAA